MVIYIKDLIELYIKKLKRDDIVNFIKKNNLNASDNEINFVYDFIKNNHKEYLNNPNKFDITLYKDKFSSENYQFIVSLLNKYSKFVK